MRRESQSQCVRERSVGCFDVPLRDGAAGGLDLEGGGSGTAQAELENTLRSHCCSLPGRRRGFERECAGTASRIDVVVRPCSDSRGHAQVQSSPSAYSTGHGRKRAHFP